MTVKPEPVPGFPLWCRVRLNENGIKSNVVRWKSQHVRLGDVVGYTHDGMVRVWWDGLKSDQKFSPGLLETVWQTARRKRINPTPEKE